MPYCLQIGFNNIVLLFAIIRSASFSWMIHTMILIIQWKGNFKSQRNKAKSNAFILVLVPTKHNMAHSDFRFLTKDGGPPLSASRAPESFKGKWGKRRRGALIHYYFSWTEIDAADEIQPASPGFFPLGLKQILFREAQLRDKSLSLH